MLPAFLLTAALAATAALHAAPVFQPIQGFPAGPSDPVGAPVFDTAGNLYGVTKGGGCNLCGAVFRMPPGGPVSRLADIPAGSDIALAGLTRGADGNFYGILGDASATSTTSGQFFRVTAAGDFTLFASFSGTGRPYPVSRLLESADSNGIEARFHGLARDPGSSDGIFYRVTSQGTLTPLAVIPHDDGLVIGDLVTGPDGDYYGVLAASATVPASLYRITPTGVRTTICTFAPRLTPTTPVLGRDGNFYLTLAGETGAVVRVTPSGTVATLYAFPVNSSLGWFPGPLACGPDGGLYGACPSDDWYLQGILYRVGFSGIFTRLHAFGTLGKGAYPAGALTLGRDGFLYGTTSNVDSLGGEGTVFKLSPIAGFASLGTLGATTPCMPAGGVAQDSAGNLVVLAASGGAEGRGGIVRISPAGELTPVADFGRAFGSQPESGPVTGPDGHVYLTTSNGAANGIGAFIRVLSSGRASIVKPFRYSKEGYFPGELHLATDGSFYTIGIVEIPDWATPAVLRITTSGRVTPVAAFDPESIPNPVYSLVQTPDGLLRGVISGDPFSQEPGSLFHVTPATGSPLVSDLSLVVPGGINLYPYSGLAAAADGTLYGPACKDSLTPDSIYRIRPGQAPEVLADSFPLGTSPDYKLVLAPDGFLYGVSRSGGTHDSGALFRVTPGGDLSLLHSFSGPDGIHPSGSLHLGADGHLYGATELGGTTSDGHPAAGGQLFRLHLGAFAVIGQPTDLTWNGATLHGTVDPSGTDTTVTFQYATEPTFRRPLTVSAGTIPAGQGSTPVTATLTGLQARRTYYVRLITTNAENPVPQASATIALTTPRR
ncbi:choice-of-anchor tandem repeat GloVer-containing protein [Luteolibacter sp. LG18]|uniref:choice-of-anchor tandem repeat GloVer-containing protein n=1 Tax=Luteolibacter sp. LG18 TaxID=2819286 RepID=UPI002B280559|nr:hypothetical protein llg_26840 [Luteolibacter sp. LG18]